MTTEFSIGKASQRSDVKVTTIRYYESIGLMPEPSRTQSGRRVYDQDSVARLGFIRHARDLGFSVDAIRGLIALQESPGTDCAAADAIAQRHLVETRWRILQLQSLEVELEHMIESCAGGSVAKCEIVTRLFDHAKCAADH